MKLRCAMPKPPPKQPPSRRRLKPTRAVEALREPEVGYRELFNETTKSINPVAGELSTAPVGEETVGHMIAISDKMKRAGAAVLLGSPTVAPEELAALIYRAMSAKRT